MQDSGVWRALGLSLFLAATGCASGANSADAASAASGASMSSSDAQAFVAEVQQKRGLPSPAPVNNIDELLDVLAGDQVRRFSGAEALVAGKPGIDAMSLHASLELAWSDDFSTLALILGELAKRADVEVKRLQTKRDTGTKLSDAEAKDLEQNQKNLEFDVKAKAALETLARDHLRASEQVVSEAKRQFPKDPQTYRVAAYYSLLSGNWLDFDAAIGKLKDEEAKDAGLIYLRGLEALSRFAVRKDAAARFRAALQVNPKLARAQAKLTLVESEIDAKYAEFEKLEALAPQHPIVWLAGPSIKSDYELSESFRKARAARQADAPAASPAPASSTPAAAPAAVPAAAAPPAAP